MDSLQVAPPPDKELGGSAAIETDDLTKQWDELVAVNSLNLTVAQVECFPFLGRNGSGKSTRVRMLLASFGRPVVRREC